MNKERNCKKCIHHISGECSKWDCEMQTLEDYRNKVIDDFAEAIKKQALWIQQYTNAFGNAANVICEKINQITEQIKANKE